MTELFGAHYAGNYDLIYRDKDYAHECSLVEELLHAHGEPPQKRLIDLGCGTGRHAEILADRGYEVVGVDRAEGMLAKARQRARQKSRLSFLAGDVRDVVAGEPHSFDAALMLFAVLSYQNENSDVLAALATVHRHLRPNGLFLFDVWFGPAVLAQGPESRSRTFEDEHGRRLRRSVTAELDLLRQRCNVTIDTAELEADRAVSESHEVHPMRFFFPQELVLLCDAAGLELLHLGKLPAVRELPDASSWNVIGVAKARGVARRQKAC